MSIDLPPIKDPDGYMMVQLQIRRNREALRRCVAKSDDDEAEILRDVIAIMGERIAEYELRIHGWE